MTGECMQVYAICSVIACVQIDGWCAQTKKKIMSSIILQQTI